MKNRFVLFLLSFSSVHCFSQNIIEDNQIYRNDFVNLVFSKSSNNKLYSITENKSSSTAVSNEFRLFIQDTMYNILQELQFSFPIEKLEVDSLGNVYLLGSFSGTVDVDPTSGTTFLSSPNMNVLNTVNTSGIVLKLNAMGSLVWSKPFHFDSGLQSWSYGFFRPGGICISNNVLFIYAHSMGHIKVDTTAYLNTNFIVSMDVSNGVVINHKSISNGLQPMTTFEMDRNYGLIPYKSGVLIYGKRYFSSAFEDAIFLNHFNSSLLLVQSAAILANNQNSNVEIVGVDTDSGSVIVTGRYTGQLNINGVLKNSSVSNLNGVKGFQSFLCSLDSGLNLQWFNNVMNIPSKISNPVVVNDRLVVHVGLEASHNAKIFYFSKNGILKFEQWVLTPGGTLATSANNSLTFPNTRGSHGVNVNWIYLFGHNIGLSNSSRPGQNVDYGNCSQVLYPQVPPIGKSCIFQVSYEFFHNRVWKLVPSDDTICSNELANIVVVNNFGHCGEIYEWSNFPNFGVILHTGNVLSNVISFSNSYYARVSSYTSSTYTQGSYTRFYNSVTPSFDTTYVYRAPSPSQILTSLVANDTVLVYLSPPVGFPVNWNINGISRSEINDTIFWYHPSGLSSSIEFSYEFEDCILSNSFTYVGLTEQSTSNGIYPIPSSGKIYLNVASQYTKCQIFNLTGKVLDIFSLNQGLCEMDLSGYPEGFYFVMLVDDVSGEQYVKKVTLKYN